MRAFRALLTLGAIAGATFGLLLADVTSGGVASRLDPVLASPLRAAGDGPLVGLAFLVDVVGEWHVTLAGLLGLALGLAIRRRLREGATIAVVALAGEAATWIAKLAVARPRPDDALAAALGYAFPSGHAARAALTAVLVGWILGPRAGLVVGLWALLVAASRIVLGVHYPTDVAGGLALGVAVAALGAAASTWAASRRPRPPAPGRA